MNQLCCFYTSSRQHEAGAPTDKGWYHGGITDAKADSSIPKVCNNGLYLVYDCPTSKRDFILLVMAGNKLHRLRIVKRRCDNQYVVGRDIQAALGHESVRKLIKYHRGLTGKPLILRNGRRVVLGDYVYKV